MTLIDQLDYPFDTVPLPGAVHPVAPGVSWVRMPLPFALDHINMWVLDDGDAITIVDTGFGMDEVRDHWKAILARDGRPISRVVVTHCHPDHVGMAAWLTENGGAPVCMTQGEFLGAHALWNQLPGYSVPDMIAQFRRHGLDATRLEALERRGNGYRRGVPALPSSFHRLFDSDRIEIGGREWLVIAGFGHSPEHASLYCDELGLLISGDMLLPRISTNVSVFAATPHDDPLNWFLESLDRLRALPHDTLVLPSHGKPFRGIEARIDQLQTHHRERCDMLLAALDTPRSAGELLPVLFDRELDTHQVLFAMGEAIAHLNYLAETRQVKRRTDPHGTIRFERNA